MLTPVISTLGSKLNTVTFASTTTGVIVLVVESYSTIKDIISSLSKILILDITAPTWSPA